MKKTIDKKDAQNKTEKKGSDKSSALQAANKVSRSAVKSAKHDSNTDVRGSNGIANTGPFVSYNDGEV